MSKLLNTIKGKAPKKMGNLTVLDGSLLEDHTPETNEFLEALSGEARGLREDQLVTGHVVDIRGKDVIIDVGYKGTGTVNLDEFNNPDGTSTSP